MTQDQDGLGGFTRTTEFPPRPDPPAPLRPMPVWDGQVDAGAFPGIPFKTEITLS